MQTLDVLQQRIKTTGDLLGVVRTMKSLAAVNIRHFERAAQSLTQYADVVEQGWTVLLRAGGVMLPASRVNRAVILVVGSDQGMCGQFNELAVRESLGTADRVRKQGMDISFWCAGDRVRSGLEDAGHMVEHHFVIPGTLGGVDGVVGQLVQEMARWQRRGVGRFYVVHNTPSSTEGYGTLEHRILPLDKAWGEKIARTPWPGRCLPQVLLPGEALFFRLFEQHLFVSLYGALARSMAAENAARLAAMQVAEKNIEEMRNDLEGEFRQSRQTSITGELLDIVAGFEAMS